MICRLTMLRNGLNKIHNQAKRKPSSYPLGGFSVPLEGCFLMKKSAFVYLFVYFFKFAAKSRKMKCCKKVWYFPVNKEKVPQNNRLRYCFLWSECRDSNPRPLGPEPSAIPSFATPRRPSYYNGKNGNCQPELLLFCRITHLEFVQSWSIYIHRQG